MENMDLWIQKADVLVEALPYIRDFAGKKVVVKYGGSAMKDAALKKSVVTDVALLKLVGMKPIIVHGGGKEISKWVKLSGRTPEFVNGLRVTDKDTMEIAEMVLNKVNKGLVQYMEENGVKACGISGKDGGTLRTVKKTIASGKDLGYVGEVTDVDPTLIDTLIDQDFIPVICPIGLGAEDYQSYNINADDAACAIRSSRTASTRLRTAYRACIFWTGGSCTACSSRSSRTEESEPLLSEMTRTAIFTDEDKTDDKRRDD